MVELHLANVDLNIKHEIADSSVGIVYAYKTADWWSINTLGLWYIKNAPEFTLALIFIDLHLVLSQVISHDLRVVKKVLE